MAQGKRFKKRWLLLSFVLASALIFHQPLLLLGCKLLLKQVLPSKSGRSVSYEKMQWEAGAIALSGLVVKEVSSELRVDRIELKFAGSFLRAHFTPILTIVHPQLTIKTSEHSQSQAPAALFLYRSRFFEPRFEVKNGVLQLPSSRFYFSMSPGETERAIGTLKVSYDPDPLVVPMFFAEIETFDRKFQGGFKLQENDLSRLVPLMTLIFPDLPRDWERVSGDIELEGSVLVDALLGIEEVHVHGAGHKIVLEGSKRGLSARCEELQGAFSFPAQEGDGFFWNQSSASLIVEGGECHLAAPLVDSALGIKTLSGKGVFEPHKEPELHLDGLLLQGEREMPFSLLGRGSVHEDATFWSEAELTLGSEMHALCSLSKYEEGALAFHVRVEDAGSEQMDFLRALKGLPGECVEGTLSGSATLLYKEGQWQSIGVEKCLLHNVGWHFPLHGIMVSAEQIEGEWTLISLDPSQWSLEDLHLKIQGGDYLNPHTHFRSLSCDLTASQGLLAASSFQGEWEGLKGDLFILGPEADHFADLTLHGELSQTPAELKIAAHLPKEGIHLELAGSVAKEPFQGNALFSMTPYTLVNALKGHFPTFLLKEGEFSADLLTCKSYGVFFPQTQDLNLVFEKTQGDLKWEGGMLKVPSFKTVCEGISLCGEMNLQLVGDAAGWVHFATSEAVGEVKNLLSTLSKSPSFPAFITPVTGEFSSGEKGITCHIPFGLDAEKPEWSFAGNFRNLSFPVNGSTWVREGHCDVAFDSKEKRLVLKEGEGIWSLRDGMPLRVQVKRLSTQDMGSVDFALRIAEGKKEFAHFEAVATRSAPSEWNVVFDAQKTHFGGVPLNIARCLFHEQRAVTAFEMRPLLNARDLHAHAAFLQNAGFLPTTFSSKNLQEWDLEGTFQTWLLSEDLNRGFFFQLDSPDLMVNGDSLGQFHVRGQKVGEKWLIEKLEAGALQLKGALIAEGGGFTLPQFEGGWNGLLMKGSGFIKTEEKRFSCTLESIRGDLSSLTSQLPLKGTFVAGASCSGDFSDLHAGILLSGEANFYIDCHSPLPVTAANTRTMQFSYQAGKGFACRGLEVQLKSKLTGAPLATLQAAKLLKPSEKTLSVEQIQFSLTRALLESAIDAHILPPLYREMHWEGNLEGGGDLQIGGAGTLFQGNLRPGSYGFEDKNAHFEQLQLRYEKELLTLRAKAQVEEQPLWASLQIDCTKELSGMLKLFDHPKAEGLKVLFSTQSSKPILESIQGSCYGLTCSLVKNTKYKPPLATALSGEIKLDANTLSGLLPKGIRDGIEPLKIGSGYAWQGDLIFWQDPKRGFSATGTLKGREFEMLGFQLQSLEATLELTPHHFLLSQLKIEDPAGVIGIKTIEFKKTEDWHLHIPQVLVRSFQPSLMRKIGVEPSEIKPFTIKNFALTDIRGRLGDTSSLYGSGHLMFINQFKKEASIFDAPLEILKKLGLDLALLTPVQGEIQVELRGDKFYLVSLDNSFSEGERAEFYLCPGKNLSFIDLDGKMHVDLKMRQDVVLKITEPFTLTIRGTLDKPRYGLQF